MQEPSIKPDSVTVLKNSSNVSGSKMVENIQFNKLMTGASGMAFPCKYEGKRMIIKFINPWVSLNDEIGGYQLIYQAYSSETPPKELVLANYYGLYKGQGNDNLFVNRSDFRDHYQKQVEYYEAKRIDKGYPLPTPLLDKYRNQTDFYFTLSPRINGITMYDFFLKRPIIRYDQTIENLSAFDVNFIIEKLIAAVRNLHIHGIYHTDLHGKNIMIDENRNIHLIDLGDSIKSIERRELLTGKGPIEGHIPRDTLLDLHAYYLQGKRYSVDKVSSINSLSDLNNIGRIIYYLLILTSKGSDYGKEMMLAAAILSTIIYHNTLFTQNSKSGVPIGGYDRILLDYYNIFSDERSKYRILNSGKGWVALNFLSDTWLDLSGFVKIVDLDQIPRPVTGNLFVNDFVQKASTILHLPKPLFKSPYQKLLKRMKILSYYILSLDRYIFKERWVSELNDETKAFTEFFYRFLLLERELERLRPR